MTQANMIDETNALEFLPDAFLDSHADLQVWLRHTLQHQDLSRQLKKYASFMTQSFLKIGEFGESSQAGHYDMQQIGGMVVPFVLQTRLRPQKETTGEMHEGVGWIVRGQRITSSGSGQHPYGLVMGCELFTENVDVEVRDLALRGLFNIFEPEVQGIRHAQNIYFLSLMSQSKKWHRALESNGFKSSGDIEGVHTAAIAYGLDFISEISPINAIVYSRKDI